MSAKTVTGKFHFGQMVRHRGTGVVFVVQKAALTAAGYFVGLDKELGSRLVKESECEPALPPKSGLVDESGRAL